MHRAAPLLLTLAACAPAPPADPEAAATAALRALFARQDQDGGFRSQVHGVLRPGCSLCATALFAAALLPERLRAPHQDGIARAFAFLARATDAEGAIGLGGPVVDYPAYTAAHYLQALVRLRPDGWRALADQQVARLCQLQLDEGEGWQPGDLFWGAFGFGVKPEPKPLGAELADLSLQVAVLEALRAAGVPAEAQVFARGRAFVERCQRMPGGDDEGRGGGFHFAPAPEFRASKAGFDRDAAGVERPRSYGTTTCDGSRALLACGAADDDARLRAARDWLDRNTTFERVPGLPADEQPPVEPALRLYWWSTLARTQQALARPGAWRGPLFASLAARQQPDGSFLGLSDRMKEDDPLVATCLGLLALSALVPP